MNTIRRLELAEQLAAEHGIWQEFARIYTNYRTTYNVRDSIEKTLRDMNLEEEYLKRLSES
jgi:hypothetical protein